ncbi:MAG TPA: glutathione S-transferase family protein [Rhodanobacteraceae bacterium]|nr:glutathione S-transferase family protein [Rhodanobacteraceae bacterium]
MERPHFYSGTRNASSWSLRAWLALRAAGIEFTETVVDIRRPQRFANLAAIGEIAPSCTVPVLVTGGRVMYDSLAIMEFANDVCDGRLLPPDPVDRAAARSLAAWQHAGLSGIARRISFESAFYPDKRTLADDEIAECARLCRWLESLLERSGGTWLFGSCSLAEFALVPAVVRLDRHRLEWSRWPRVARWAAAVLDLPDVREWLAEADRLAPIWYDDYMLEPERVPSAASAWTTVAARATG